MYRDYNKPAIKHLITEFSTRTFLDEKKVVPLYKIWEKSRSYIIVCSISKGDAAGSARNKKNRCPFGNNRSPRKLRSHAPIKTCRCAAFASYNVRLCRQWLGALGNHFSSSSSGIDRPAVITGYNEMAPPCTAREGNRDDRRTGRAGEKCTKYVKGLLYLFIYNM